ncbi:MAG: argininosuccinate lyase [Pleomorphochaeta sp.]
MGKLWQKEYSLDSLMEDFTVSNDYILDQDLVISDALASIAHARGLNKINILSDDELKTLEKGLQEVINLRENDSFEITKENEDCHTAIESYLTTKYGDVGKKIHTGRSRNDQVQTALRVWMREFSIKLSSETAKLAKELLEFADKYKDIPMPGRTHMQIAMPSSVGLWAASFAEEFIDEANRVDDFLKVLDQSPLGSAASYGVPLDLDRAYTAKEMGFSKVQKNVLYANNSRGKFEAMLLDLCDYIALTCSKLAQDLILFTLPEFGYFSLPKELCTGSSIMPQKKNPDGLELARSRSAVVSSTSIRVKTIIRSLPSGYNRDFQDTKEPLLVGTKATWSLVAIMNKMMNKVEVHSDNLAKACVSDLYATDEVLERVKLGENFRDTYKNVGLNLDAVKKYDPYETIKNRSSIGTTNNLCLLENKEEAISLIKKNEEIIDRFKMAYKGLCGLDIEAVNL